MIRGQTIQCSHHDFGPHHDLDHDHDPDFDLDLDLDHEHGPDQEPNLDSDHDFDNGPDPEPDLDLDDSNPILRSAAFTLLLLVMDGSIGWHPL